MIFCSGIQPGLAFFRNLHTVGHQMNYHYNIQLVGNPMRNVIELLLKFTLSPAIK